MHCPFPWTIDQWKGKETRPTLSETTLDRTPHPFSRRPSLDLGNSSIKPILPSILLMIRIPSFYIIRISHRGPRHQLILFDRIDIHAHVFSHESDAEGMGESSDFEWFACHGTRTLVI
jgi:hypothetical protein